MNSFDTQNPLPYMERMRPIILFLCLLLPLAAQAQEAEQYRHCLSQARLNPDDGLEEALAWQSMGGGEPARHCMALARIGQKQYEDGAKRLEALALESRQDKAIRAQMLSQAAEAWTLAENWDRADADQRSALTLVPDQPDILVDHAVTLGQVHHYQEAADELTHVLALYPNRIDALVLRASAKRYLDNRKGALLDVERALLLDPSDIDGLLERGILRRLDGDKTGARADWMRIVKSNPNSATAEAARRNLELLDVEQR